MLFQKWSGVEELDVPRLNVVLIDSISLFLGLQITGEMLEYCDGFCWCVLQMAWHFKNCEDTLAVKGYSFVLFMSPLSLVGIVIPHIAVLDLSMLSIYN